MLLALPVLFIQYSQYKGLYMHYFRILPKHISHTVDCNKPVQIIRNQILFILGLSIRNKLTVWFLWSQGTFGSQLCWLTPGLKKKKKKKAQWVLAAGGDASCVCCSAVQEMCSASTYLGNAHISHCLPHVFYVLAHQCTEAVLRFFCMLLSKNCEKRAWGGEVWSRLCWGFSGNVEMRCEHNTHLAFEISGLKFHISGNGYKSDAFFSVLTGIKVLDPSFLKGQIFFDWI